MKIPLLVALLALVIPAQSPASTDVQTALDWYTSEMSHANKPDPRVFGNVSSTTIRIGIFDVVANAGVYNIEKGLSLTQVLQLAGGRTFASRGGDILLVRKVGDKLTRQILPEIASDQPSYTFADGDLICILWHSL